MSAPIERRVASGYFEITWTEQNSPSYVSFSDVFEKQEFIAKLSAQENVTWISCKYIRFGEVRS